MRRECRRGKRLCPAPAPPILSSALTSWTLLHQVLLLRLMIGWSWRVRRRQAKKDQENRYLAAAEFEFENEAEAEAAVGDPEALAR